MKELTKGQLRYWGVQFIAQFSGWTVEERIRVLEYLLSQEKSKLQSKEATREATKS